MRGQYEPLTEQQKAFANQHYDLIFKFMTAKKLTMEWYDILAIGYLKAVKKWFKREDLHQYCFSTIAFYKMRAEVGIEREKEKRRLKTVSLDAVMQDSFTFGDVITDKNLIYVAYIGSEDMEIAYDVDLPPKRGNKIEETLAVEEFLVSDKKNMCITYETVQQAMKKCECLQATRRKNNAKHLYDVYRVEKCICIKKTEEFFKKVEREKRKRKEQICTNI